MRHILLLLAIAALVTVQSGETFAKPARSGRATAARTRGTIKSPVLRLGAALLFFGAIGCDSKPSPPRPAAPSHGPTGGGTVEYGPGNSVRSQAWGQTESHSESYSGPEGSHGRAWGR